MDLSAIEEIVVRYNNGRPSQIYRGNGLNVFLQRVAQASTPEHVYEARRGRNYLVVGDMSYQPTPEDIARSEKIISQ
jgi:hypothetical protein